MKFNEFLVMKAIRILDTEMEGYRNGYSAYAVHKEVKQLWPDSSATTTYRILRTLEGVGFIEKAKLPDNPQRITDTSNTYYFITQKGWTSYNEMEDAIDKLIS